MRKKIFNHDTNKIKKSFKKIFFDIFGDIMIEKCNMATMLCCNYNFLKLKSFSIIVRRKTKSLISFI